VEIQRLGLLKYELLYQRRNSVHLNIAKYDERGETRDDANRRTTSP
jgi:hypothetical protein